MSTITVQAHKCDHPGCGRVFLTPRGLQIHTGHIHQQNAVISETRHQKRQRLLS